jgi:hypothetical protein
MVVLLIFESQKSNSTLNLSHCAEFDEISGLYLSVYPKLGDILGALLRQLNKLENE